MAIHNSGPINDRRQNEEIRAVDYFHGKKSFFDASKNIKVVRVFAGDCYISKEGGVMMSTILGSCISACIRDPLTGVGGMNHFLLPGHEDLDNRVSTAARYGVFAMERLINGILSANGQKSRLEIKVFGGGNITNNSARIGSMNAEFVRAYLKKEGFRIASEDLEGNQPRCIHYYSDTGRVMVRSLRRQDDLVVVEEEARYSEQINQKPIAGGIELF